MSGERAAKSPDRRANAVEQKGFLTARYLFPPGLFRVGQVSEYDGDFGLTLNVFQVITKPRST